MSYTLTQKRMVRVTLDIMCYDDFPLKDLDWKELLHLKVMRVDVDIEDYQDIF